MRTSTRITSRQPGTPRPGTPRQLPALLERLGRPDLAKEAEAALRAEDEERARARVDAAAVARLREVA